MSGVFRTSFIMWQQLGKGTQQDFSKVVSGRVAGQLAPWSLKGVDYPNALSCCYVLLSCESVHRAHTHTQTCACMHHTHKTCTPTHTHTHTHMHTHTHTPNFHVSTASLASNKNCLLKKHTKGGFEHNNLLTE